MLGKRDRDGGDVRGGAKRAAAKAAERYRSDVRAIYDASKALEAEVPSTSATAQDSYLYILSVALSGLSCGTRHLASHLIPRHCGRFPGLLSRSADALVALASEAEHSKDEHEYRCFGRATAQEALKGLSQLCQVAMDPRNAMGVVDTSAIVSKACDVLLRRLEQALKLVEGEVETGPADGSCFDPSDPEGGWALARGAVVRALAMCPQAVLPAMLRAVERGEREGQSRAEAVVQLFSECAGGGEEATASKRPDWDLVAMAGKQRPETVKWIRATLELWYAGLKKPSRHPWAEALIERLRATPDAPRAPPLDIRVASCTLLVSAPSELPWESVWETCNAIAEDRGAVLHIQPLPGPHHEATVTLTTIDAALSVFERIGRKGPGFRVDFVAHDPADAARQPEDPAGHFLWVGQVTSSKALSGVLRQLEEAGFPEGSFEVTRVGMPRPSVLLRMKGRDEAERAAQSLVTSTLRVLRPQQHPPSKVKVSGLRPATNRDDVAALFKDLGLRLKRMQRLCPFAILEFTTPLGAAMAVATLNMRGLGGGLLKVEVWEDAPEPGTQAQGAAAQGQGGEKGAGAEVAMSQGVAGAESARDASQAGPDPEARAVGVEWEGQLLRTGAPLCQLFCRTRSRSGAEPTSWPGKVDIRMWVQLGHFLEREVPRLEQRGMHVISLTTSILKNDRRNLVDLLNDMAQKGRAGVARLPPAGGHGGPRVLYLVPPSNSICARFAIEWSPKEMFVGIVSSMEAKMAAAWGA